MLLNYIANLDKYMPCKYENGKLLNHYIHVVTIWKVMVRYSDIFHSYIIYMQFFLYSSDFKYKYIIIFIFEFFHSVISMCANHDISLFLLKLSNTICTKMERKQLALLKDDFFDIFWSLSCHFSPFRQEWVWTRCRILWCE